MRESVIGVALLLAGAGMSASFALPMKYTFRWKWENTWLVWTIFALLVFPPIVTYATVPRLMAVYRGAGAESVAMVAAQGAGWGVAQIFFGLAIDSIGIALALSIALGISAAAGCLIPLIRLHPATLFTAAGERILVGVGLVILGVAICAVAGRRRELMLDIPGGSRHSSMTRGLSLSFLSGMGASFLNFGLAFGGRLLASAERLGAKSFWAPNVVWLPLMLAGAIPNLVYCLYLLKRNGTMACYTKSGTIGHWFLAFTMAFLWVGSTLLYGVSVERLGGWGPILGWPLFTSLVVIIASAIGVATGEWKNTGRQPLRMQLVGVATLVMSVFVLATANS